MVLFCFIKNLHPLIFQIIYSLNFVPEIILKFSFFQAEHGGSRQNNELMSQINLRLRQFEEHIQSNRSQIEESNTQDG